ncbi:MULTISPECIES: hypothetical protein [unclassified Mycobacterium]|uniref:hypothetical protein n=1 Tax=unclassified Mycobacterium TaxID=2642494 RepID=UPI0027429070|nr:MULTISPECIES: hypothetical protein [unclassified Mycobacterium]MDP7703698.1 hypothetical protein [Mycobacterium sp. TY815]MDP7722179.1 hypothetical protein [Mycobacterium sp. TY814]
MSDGVQIEPSEVKNAGKTIETESAQARGALVPLFDSARPAASGNLGFATGAKLVALADLLKREMDSTITILDGTGHAIVSSAQALYNADNTHGMNIDTDNATGISRIATALNGLGKPPEQ